MSKQDKQNIILCLAVFTLWALAETIVNILTL